MFSIHLKNENGNANLFFPSYFMFVLYWLRCATPTEVAVDQIRIRFMNIFNGTDNKMQCVNSPGKWTPTMAKEMHIFDSDRCCDRWAELYFFLLILMLYSMQPFLFQNFSVALVADLASSQFTDAFKLMWKNDKTFTDCETAVK